MRVVADREACIGATLCSSVSAMFELGRDSKVVVVADGHVDPQDLDAAEEAIEMCPVQALMLTEEPR